MPQHRPKPDSKRAVRPEGEFLCLTADDGRLNLGPLAAELPWKALAETVGRLVGPDAGGQPFPQEELVSLLEQAKDDPPFLHAMEYDDGFNSADLARVLLWYIKERGVLPKRGKTIGTVSISSKSSLRYDGEMRSHQEKKDIPSLDEAKDQAAQLATEFGAQARAFVDAAESADERTQRGRLLATQLIRTLPQPVSEGLAHATAPTEEAPKVEAEIEPPCLPAANRVRLTVEEMQQELDRLIGKTFGSAEAKKDQVNVIKAYLKASNLQLLYEGQTVNIRVVTAPGSREGSFQILSTGTDRKHIAASPSWPRLTAAPRTSVHTARPA